MIYKLISGLITIFLISTVIYSRLILGVHSLDQVILGSLIGFSIASIYMIKLKQTLNSLLM